MPRSYALELQTFRSILIGTTVNLGLLTSAPGGNSPGVEVIGAGYSRVPMNLTEVGVMCAINSATLTFTPTGTWPTAQYFGIYDIAGALQYWGVLARAVCTRGGTITIPAGAIFIDWVGHANAYHATWNSIVTSSLPTAQIVLSQAEPVTSLPAIRITVTAGGTVYSLEPLDQSRVFALSARPQPVGGSIAYWPMHDNTMGSPAGFTVSIPAGLAY